MLLYRDRIRHYHTIFFDDDGEEIDEIYHHCSSLCNINTARPRINNDNLKNIISVLNFFFITMFV